MLEEKSYPSQEKGNIEDRQPELNSFVQSLEKEIVILREVKDTLQSRVRNISNKTQPREENPNKRKPAESALEVCWELLEGLRETRRDLEDIKRQLSEIVG